MRRRWLGLPPQDPALPGGSLLVLLGMILFLMALLLPGWLGLADVLLGSRTTVQALIQAGAWSLAALPILVGSIRPRDGFASLGLSLERPLFQALLGGGVIWLIGSLVWLPLFGLYGGLLHVLEVANHPQPVYLELARSLTQGKPDPVLLLLVCLFLPMAEEFFFRGALHGLLRGVLPRGATIVLVAGLFALLHGPWTVIFPVFLLGLLFGYARERTGSIWGAWAAHALHNSVAVGLSPYMIQLYDRIEPVLGGGA